LLDKGLIAMDSDQADRRRQRLSVAEAGTAVLRRGIVGSKARQARLRGRLTEADHEVLDRVLATLTDEAQKMLADAKERAETEP
jgi:DNA-binding MarR family transcriptional regulator